MNNRRVVPFGEGCKPHKERIDLTTHKCKGPKERQTNFRVPEPNRLFYVPGPEVKPSFTKLFVFVLLR